MKKYSFLVYHQEYIQFLNDLQDLGVVHIITKDTGDIEDEELLNKYNLLNQFQNIINSLKKRNVPAQNHESGEINTIIEEIVNINKHIDDLEQQQSQLDKEISLLEPWGDFNPDEIKKLEDIGLHYKYYMTSAKKFNDEWGNKYNIKTISAKGSVVYFVIINQEDQIIDLDAEEIKIPNKSLKNLLELKENVKIEKDNLNKDLDEYASKYIVSLENAVKQLKGDIDFENVVISTAKEAENKLMILHGWVPESKQEEMVSFLENSKSVYFEDEIKSEDKIPVLLKNNKFAKLYEPIGDLFSLPSYNELDLTPFFAPFYMLFFGFCLGDAGYGALMTIASIILIFKLNAKAKPVVKLVMYLGISTIIFGLIGGTFFGINLYETSLPVYAELQASFKLQETNINEILFNLSIVIGAIQILFGMFIKAFNEIKQLGLKYALSTFGWLIILLGVVIFKILDAKKILPPEVNSYFLYSILIVGGALVFLFNTPGKNIFLNIGTGIWDSYNMATGILGDLLSYIRLFALGISSAILGFVFNSLAVSMRPDIPVLDIIVMVIILAIGHGINLFMSGLGSFVHPMRLTFVEFYKNAGFTGGGKKYNPFRKL